MLKPRRGEKKGRMRGMNVKPHHEWFHTDVDTFESAAGAQLEPPDPFG